MDRDTTVTSDTLQQLNTDGLLTAEDLQRLFAWSRSTAFRRLAGDVDLSLDEAIVICRNSPPPVALAICRALTAGTGIDHNYIEGDADVDGDGDVDTDDLLASAAETGDAFAGQLRAITESSADGRIDHHEAERLIAACDQVRRAASIAERVVGLIRRKPRRACRPLPVHGDPGSNGKAVKR